MGVAGCGKSTIAAMLAERLNATMIEADELHGEANIEKMGRGEALNDRDRLPWLKRVANKMHVSPVPTVVSCSALRRSYRQCLMDTAQVPIGFIHLHASQKIIAERMSNRDGHFMPTSLLDSQFEALEPLNKGEVGIVLDIEQSIEQVVENAVQYASSKMRAKP